MENKSSASVAKVSNLRKHYDGFELSDVSFCLEKGAVTGFVGRNGAGKSTTIKSLLNLVHPDSGEIEFFGLDIKKNEQAIKQKIGYASAGVHYYERKKIKDIIAVTARFYENWDHDLFNGYMQKFGIDVNKKPIELSEGMKVKFSLAAALSHGAELLILDEPTSGLDPVSREELLEIFMALSKEGTTILFSTHIITDIEKCADNIIYIQKGKIIAICSVKDFTAGYKIVKIGDQQLGNDSIIGTCAAKDGYTALVKTEQSAGFENVSDAGCEDIMIHLEKEETI